MAAIITEKFSLHNAEQFFESFSEAAPHVYYMLFGKTTPYTAATSGGTDLLPPAPANDVSNEYYMWDQATAGKKLATSDISYAIIRRDWENNTIYDRYEDNVSVNNLTTSGKNNLYKSTFYFRTSDRRVYKVMDNNGGLAYSGSEPTSESNFLFSQGGYILKYMYNMTVTEQTKFLTLDFMPVSTDSTVSAAAVDGKIESLIITPGSGYTNGTYYTSVNGDGVNAGTSSGAIVSFVVSSGRIQKFGLIASSDTVVYEGGAGYRFGTVTLTDATVFTDAALTIAVDTNVINGGAAGAIQIVISPKNGHGYDAVAELGGHYVMMNSQFGPGAERDDLHIGNDFRNIFIVTDPTTYGTSTVASDDTVRQTYATKLTGVSGAFSADEKITQASTGAVGTVVEYDATNTILYYQQERYSDYGTNSTGVFVLFSGANVITGATSNESGTPDLTADSAVTLANSFTITFTNGYANPELQPDSGNIIYTENASPKSRSAEQLDDYKIIVEF
jgi:hypothetical protein